MSLISELAEIAAKQPQKIALITETSQMSYADLLDLIQRLDGPLAMKGLRAGHTIALDSSRAEFVIAMIFLASLRGLTLALAPSARCRAVGLIPDFSLVHKTDPTLPRDRQIVIEPGWFSTPLRQRADYRGLGKNTAHYIFQSSGSTGQPKLVIAEESEWRAAMAHAMSLGTDPERGQRLLSTLAPTTNWAAGCNIETLLIGGSIVSLRTQSDRLLQYIDLYRVDTLATAPGMVPKILEMPQAGQYLTSLRDAIFAGAVVSPALLDRFAELSTARLHIDYGSTEVGVCFRAIYHPGTPQTPGHVGRLVRPDLEVVFCDDSLTPDPEACEGRIAFRRPAGQMRAYIDRTGPDETGAGFTDEGLFLPGDLMRREGEDYFILGRVKNIVNCGGNKYRLEHITQILEQAFPGSQMVPLIETGRDDLEGIAVAYRAPKEITAAEMMAVLKPQFRGLDILRIVRRDSFPLTPTGKIDRPALSELLAEHN
ncbi:class I adenylate-forming enzyme family protein [Celeribacter persicus]|uniref:Acyl-CoA synthetase (AMP-forming)/AMP-acid ligase II n=1 Tax=Celeribacter persicus TaxID=1651082 RepID=A0A2T5HS25_9RHOB|nr:class I adenylate-forming enzyme family protein [Celeribacter persicus]PTQ74371.1 acyl-CoA synthetase (AMP-forming)/AMP-acid ligase II [Celeribacter persicus]